MEENYVPELEVVISAVDQNTTTLAAAMNLQSDAIIVNQCHEFAYSEYTYRTHLIRCFHCDERGVGKSRNITITHARGEIILFSDEDILYREGYKEDILKEFAAHPEADMILFNMKQS
ncbi:MAG: glycosyltransferase family 2 protein, partial [Butyrivibrio sp.]|uniref:glycosyltransferase family A protein n=1 Tax=Butyrivibrio sp. TaxID=28121 RepID=UPI0025E389AC